jgi:hypothetical protein
MAAETFESLSEGKAVTAPGHEVITKDPDILGARPSSEGRGSCSRPCWTIWEEGKLWMSSSKISPPSAVKLPLAPSSTPSRWSSASCNEAAARRMSS